MRAQHTLALDESGCLAVTAERPARVIFQYKTPDSGGAYFLEPTDKENTYRLAKKATDTLRACVADPSAGTCSIMVEYSGFARVEITKAELMKAVA